MFKNYLKTAWRNLWKNKFYSTINISGLAIGLAVGIMILLWVQNELSYDRFHINAKQVYKINSHLGTGSAAQVWGGSPAPLAVISKQSIPEVANAVRIRKRYEQLLFTNGNNKIVETNSAFVDPSFFSVFSFDLLKGNTAKPFRDDNSIVITQSTAEKYFGTDNVIGKILVNGKDIFTVSGVLKDFPPNSSIQFDMLFPLSFYANKIFGGNGAWKTVDEDLGNYAYDIYLQLQNNASTVVVEKKVTRLFIDKKGDGAKDDFFTLQPLSSVHLITPDGNTSALQTVRIFLLIAILILLIACINYVNLSTARSMLRAKEVSMRKIIGALKYQLFIQFIAESFVLYVLASLLAFLIIYLLLPVYNDISGKQLIFNLSNPDIWLVIGCTITGTLIAGSIYPALLLTSFKPLEALKGKLTAGIGTTSFRKVLVVTQFVFSVVLIIGTIVITKQLKFIKEKDLGYDREHVFSIALTNEMNAHYDAVRNELLKQPSITGVGASDNNVIGDGSTTGDTYWDGKEAGSAFYIHPTGIDEKLIPLLKMKMMAGNNFSGMMPADSAHFILNETAVKQAGIKDPIGKAFTLWQTKGTIIGVVKDFNYASLREAIEPAIFYYYPSYWQIYIKTTGKEAAQAIAAAQKVWKKYSADYPFQYSFMDDDYNKLYQSEEKAATLMNVFAVVAIVISCLGLFGLVTFTANTKMKEIGIRKVLGASFADITTLLSKEFVLLVIIAFVIAAPFAWWAMNKWLQDFTYRITINWLVFVYAALAAIAIALLTVSFQSIKAAIANPVKSLRSE